MKNWKEVVITGCLVISHSIGYAQSMRDTCSGVLNSTKSIEPLYTSKNKKITILPWFIKETNYNCNQETLQNISDTVWKKVWNSYIYFIWLNADATKILIKVDNSKSETRYYILQGSWTRITETEYDYYKALDKLK
jgi:hypothetical protein